MLAVGTAALPQAGLCSPFYKDQDQRVEKDRLFAKQAIVLRDRFKTSGSLEGLVLPGYVWGIEKNYLIPALEDHTLKIHAVEQNAWVFQSMVRNSPRGLEVHHVHNSLERYMYSVQNSSLDFAIFDLQMTLSTFMNRRILLRQACAAIKPGGFLSLTVTSRDRNTTTPYLGHLNPWSERRLNCIITDITQRFPLTAIENCCEEYLSAPTWMLTFLFRRN